MPRSRKPPAGEQPPESQMPEEESSRPGGRAGSRRSSGSRSTTSNPIDVEGARFEPPKTGDPDLGGEELNPYEPPPPELIEWTPERAGAVVRGMGFALHSADPISAEPEAGELWRATQEDADAIGSPLARILNRYAPARRLAGLSDEAELAFALAPYAKRNMMLRGRALQAKRAREATGEDPAASWPERPPGPDLT